MKLWNHYHTPQTVDDAIRLLSQYAGQARIIAGGTDLLVEIRAEDHPPQEALIDITRIPSLTQITHQLDEIRVGAGVTHSQIVRSAQLLQSATCLVESCGVVGGPQVRNVGTIGGNVAHALPAGDATTSLVALNAQAEIIQNGQRQWVPILDMYRGPGQSLLDSTRDLLLGFRFEPASGRTATAFKRVMRPQGVALPVLGCAVWVKLSDDGLQIQDIRFSIAPIAPKPLRVSQLESALIGKSTEEDTIQYAGEFAQSCIQPRTSKYRATAEYRHELIAVLVRRTLALAIRRAKSGEIVPEGIGL
jgi:carbon-monoxide dehydrogenase medium subunit